MKRRDFLGCAAAVPAAVAGNASSRASRREQETSVAQCRITVLRKTLHRDFYRKYAKRDGSVCDVFEEGQEFLMPNPYSPPKDFCPWAWADIRSFIHAVQFGGRKTTVACCTDGYRPVSFLIERIDP
jgi:uncharacterized repeat protein (TIGR04076 family)